MKYLGKYYFIILFLFVILGGISLYNLSLRPKLPFDIVQSAEGLKIVKDSVKDSVLKLENSIITSVENVRIQREYELDDIIDRKKIGEEIRFGISDGQKYRS